VNNVVTNPQQCPLCSGDSILFNQYKDRVFYRCCKCMSVYLSPENYLSVSAEKERYEQHNNNVDDEGYRKFVSPLVNAVLSKYNCSSIGLDFGAGTGPVTTKILSEKNYSIKLYDPFFRNDSAVLESSYDFIICCEVMEHFKYPSKEFSLLNNLLNTGGTLFCMTNLLNEKIDFDKWYYKNDKTHVFFYSADAIKYISKNYGFLSFLIDGGLIIFSK